MYREEFAIIHHAERFEHHDAAVMFRRAVGCDFARTVVIDLARAQDATTSAFAHLVLLRRVLLRTGRDLRLIGLRDRAAKIYEVNRLRDVLPAQ